MQAVVAVFADQFGVKPRNGPVDDLDGIEGQPPDGEPRTRERDDGGLIFLGKRESETGHAEWGLWGVGGKTVMKATASATAFLREIAENCSFDGVNNENFSKNGRKAHLYPWNPPEYALPHGV